MCLNEIPIIETQAMFFVYRVK